MSGAISRRELLAESSEWEILPDALRFRSSGSHQFHSRTSDFSDGAILIIVEEKREKNARSRRNSHIADVDSSVAANAERSVYGRPWKHNLDRVVRDWLYWAPLESYHPPSYVRACIASRASYLVAYARLSSRVGIDLFTALRLDTPAREVDNLWQILQSTNVFTALPVAPNDLDQTYEPQLAALRAVVPGILNQPAEVTVEVPDWLAGVQRGAGVDLEPGALGAMFEGIRTSVDRGEAATLDGFLAHIRPGDMTPKAMVGLLRYTFPVRHLLNGWPKLFEDLARELETRNVDTTTVLRGMHVN